VRLTIRTAAIVTTGVATPGPGACPALAHGGGSDGVRAASYVNPDDGGATENPDVEVDSSCARPDRKDRQQLSDRGATSDDVHNDACCLDREGQNENDPASPESSGVGSTSACPDPRRERTGVLEAVGHQRGRPGRPLPPVRLPGDRQAR